MIDIVQYRCQIGGFCQRLHNCKYSSNRLYVKTNNNSYYYINFVRIFLIFCLSIIMFPKLILYVWFPSICYSTAGLTLTCNNLVPVRVTTYCCVRENTGNFWARYITGNIQSNIKGIKNIHFNIRSLKNKLFEVKNIIKKESPHIFGLSECELKKGTFDQHILKIPGYNVFFPKSWNVSGFARVLVYVKHNIECQQINDLEHNVVQ